MSVTKENGCIVIRPSYGLMANDPEVLAAVDRLLTAHGSRTPIAIVDVTSCLDANDAGAEMLKVIHAMVVHTGGHAALAGARDNVLAFLERNDVAPHFHQYRTFAHAVESFTAP